MKKDQNKNDQLIELGIEELEPRMEMAIIPTTMLVDKAEANVLANCSSNTNCAGGNCVAGCGGGGGAV